MKTREKPIGVFDSGLGGLTVVKELIKVLPHENIIYLGDTARVPYGNRSKKTIEKFSLEDANFLLEKGVKCIIIACNTSSALAGEYLRKRLNVPVFEVITPAIKAAQKNSEHGKIGVIGTRGTIESGAYKATCSQACPLFVPFIEEGDIKSRALELVANSYFLRFKNYEVDTLILGCTHYPIIQDLIAKVMGNKTKLINPGEFVAKDVAEYLTANELFNRQKKSGHLQFYVTDLTKRFVNMAEMFLGKTIVGNLKKTVL